MGGLWPSDDDDYDIVNVGNIYDEHCFDYVTMSVMIIWWLTDDIDDDYFYET